MRSILRIIIGRAVGEVASEMDESEAQRRRRHSLEGGRQEILENLRASTAAAFGEGRVAEANVREALETSAHSVWLVGSEPLEPLGMEPYRHD